MTTTSDDLNALSDALKTARAENERLELRCTDYLARIQQIADSRDRTARELIADRDRARTVAVALEQELAAAEAERGQLAATLDHVRAVADEWGEPYHCGWLSASVLVRQLRAALDTTSTPETDQ